MKRTDILSNNITLISQQLKNTHSITISVNFKTGSLYENNNNSGISHLVEHMFFRKWDNLNQSELYSQTASLGAEITGTTFNDYVRFSITIIPEFFAKAFDIIAKCLNKFSWDEVSVNDEKKVVIKQIQNNYQSYRNWVDSHYFKDTAYERAIMGTISTVKSLSVKEINDWKDKYFGCDNACVVITGNYSDSDLKTAQLKLSQIKNNTIKADMIICYPKNFSNRNVSDRYTILSDNSDYTDVNIFFDISSDCDYETVRLLSSMLGEGYSSVLSIQLREKSAFTDDVYTDLISFCGFHRLSVSFCVDNADFFECMKLFFKTISNFKKDISQENYNSSIEFFTRNQIMDFDNPKTLNERYALCDFIIESTLSEPIQLKKKYESISTEDLTATANKIFDNKNISFLIQSQIPSISIENHLEQLIKEESL